MKIVQTAWITRVVPRPNRIKMILDACLLAACYPLAYVLRGFGGMPPGYLLDVLATTALLVPLKVAIFASYGQYRVIWRYTSVQELVGLVKGASLGTAAAIILASAMRLQFSGSGIFIDWLLTVMLLGGVRLAARLRSERAAEGGQVRRVLLNGQNGRPGWPRKALIYGAGDAGEMIARDMMRRGRGHAYRPLGFIDDERSKHGMSIHGLRVLGGRENIETIVRRLKVDEIIIAIPSARGNVVRELVHACEKSGARLKILPALDEIVDGRVRIADIRGVRVEDLLGRERVDLNLEVISSYLGGKRVLVTGAGGSIGSELCRQIIPFRPAELLLFGRGENSIFRIHEELTLGDPRVLLRQIIGDVINRKKLAGIFRLYRPEVVFHAGGDKHVPLMELNPDEAVLNNILGTSNLLDVAGEFRAERVVCISTDKAVNPTSLMGCCKRVAEILVQRKVYGDTHAVAVRFGNVLGSRGSVIPVFRRQIERGGPVTVTHPEVRRFFMTIREAAQLVVKAGAIGQSGDLFILDMGEPIRILELARDMIRLAGYEPDVDMALRITGLRPGEKIKEELMLATENCESTAHEKILRVRPDGGPGPAELAREISRLTELAVDMDFHGIVRKLQQLVPEFTPRSTVMAEGDAAPRVAASRCGERPVVAGLGA